MEIQGIECNRTDLANEIAKRYDHDAEQVDDILKALANVLPDALSVYERVEFHGLGVFRLAHRSPLHGHVTDNQGQGHDWQTPARLKIKFKAALPLAKIISERKGVEVY